MAQDPDDIRQARWRFCCMAGAYSLGVYNDNFFKQVALILAVAAGQNSMQGFAVAVFTLPFLVFAAPAGWAADRFPKRKVVLAAKWTELVAMLAGAAGICTGSWPLLFTMLAVMGVQATFFSPALNGSIPELYPESYVPRANAVLRMLVTVAILGGVALAGVVLDRPGQWAGIERGRWLVGFMVVGIAFLGLLVSFGVPNRPAANPLAPYPWNGPIHTLGQLRRVQGDGLLLLSVVADVLLWSIGSLGVLLLNPLGMQEFGLGKSLTSALVACQLVGIGAGGFAGGRLLSGPLWYRRIPAGFLLMSACLGAMPLVPLLEGAAGVPVLFTLTALLGAAGGLLLIPVESFLQVRPPAQEKGAVWSAVNFAVFSGIFLSGFVANWLNARFRPTDAMGWVGVATLVAAGGLWWMGRFREAKTGRSL